MNVRFKTSKQSKKEKLAVAGFQCHAIQDKNQNRSMDKDQNLANERR